MKMWSLRLWTREDLTQSPFPFVDAFEKRSSLKVENINTYGGDGSSFRIDLRFDASATSKTSIEGFLKGRDWGFSGTKWHQSILNAEINDWKEPDEVQRGMNLGTLLARRLRAYNIAHPKRRMKTDMRTLSHFTAYMVNHLWGIGIQVPYWHKENDEKLFKAAYDYMVDGAVIPSKSFVIIDRVLHNFLQATFDVGEKFVQANLMSWMLVTLMVGRGGVGDSGKYHG